MAKSAIASCMVCGQVKPFKVSVIDRPQTGVCFDCCNAIEDLNNCRQILAFDMTHEPTDAPLPEPNYPLGVSVAASLFGAIQELRQLRHAAVGSARDGDAS